MDTQKTIKDLKQLLASRFPAGHVVVWEWHGLKAFGIEHDGRTVSMTWDEAESVLRSPEQAESLVARLGGAPTGGEQEQQNEPGPVDPGS